MTPQPIDNYRLTSLEEPTDEMLAQLMHEAAEEARESNREATERFFEEIKQAATASYAMSYPDHRPVLLFASLTVKSGYI